MALLPALLFDLLASLLSLMLLVFCMYRHLPDQKWHQEDWLDMHPMSLEEFSSSSRVILELIINRGRWVSQFVRLYFFWIIECMKTLGWRKLDRFPSVFQWCYTSCPKGSLLSKLTGGNLRFAYSDQSDINHSWHHVTFFLYKFGNEPLGILVNQYFKGWVLMFNLII